MRKNSDNSVELIACERTKIPFTIRVALSICDGNGEDVVLEQISIVSFCWKLKPFFKVAVETKGDTDSSNSVKLPLSVVEVTESKAV